MKYDPFPKIVWMLRIPGVSRHLCFDSAFVLPGPSILRSYCTKLLTYVHFFPVVGSWRAPDIEGPDKLPRIVPGTFDTAFKCGGLFRTAVPECLSFKFVMTMHVSRCSFSLKLALTDAVTVPYA